MTVNIINEQDYYRIVYGGWLGKNIGGTLGAPVEGKKELLELQFYPSLPDGPLENDDLDLQLVWLHALEQYGPRLTSRELGQEWLEHIFFPFDEYGYALTNLRNGLVAPVAGAFNNPFIHCMGAPIRSEIWAMTAPGAPHIAAYYAYQDAIVDHAGGEGVYGELFFAAIQSAVFYERDRDRLIDIGMKFMPDNCRTAMALKDLLRWHAEGVSWIEARSLILKHHGNDNFTDAPQNVAFTILGWLYGESFEDAILKAVNCGYDTDCTAATLGAILGMILGPEDLPSRWAAPVGDAIVVSPAVNGFESPLNLDELTRRTMDLGKQILAFHHVNIEVHTDRPTNWNQKIEPPLQAVIELWNKSLTSIECLLPQGNVNAAELHIDIEFGTQGPAIGSYQSKRLQLTVTNRATVVYTGRLELKLPEGWEGPDDLPVRLIPGQPVQWDVEITAGKLSTGSHQVALHWVRMHDGTVWAVHKADFALVSASEWTIWGPDDALGQEVNFAGNRIDWDALIDADKDGVYRAETMLHVPSERKAMLIAAANCPVRLKLDGATVIDSPDILEFVPAYHRAPLAQRVELDLPAGDFHIEVEAIRSGRPIELFVLAVGPAITDTPGPRYCYTDVLFGVSGVVEKDSQHSI